MIAATTALVALVALALSVTQKKQYTATATLLFQNVNYAQGLFGTSSALSNTAASLDPTREAATNLGLVQQSIIAQRTAQELAGQQLGSQLTQAKVLSYLSINASGQSDLINIAATTGSPSFASRVANTYAQAFINYRKQADSSAILNAEREVAARLKLMSPAQKNAPAGRELSARQQDLNILASLQTGNAQLSEPATAPDSPSSPKPVRNLLIGVFAGFLLGLVLAVVLERFDRRVRDPAEFEALFGRPVLALIPRSRRLAAQRADASSALNAEDVEPFRLLRANLRYLQVDGDIRTLVISSSAPQEGKSTVAYNLALVSASTGQRVVLVEGDLRRPVLGRMVRRESGRPGLSDVLAGRTELRNAIERLPITMHSSMDEAFNENQGELGLDVIPAGVVPPNPSDLLESNRMSQLVTYLRSEYDLVIIDTPPTSAVSDAVHLLGQVDGVLVIARLGTTTRDLAGMCSRQLAQVKAPVLGIVVNGASDSPEYRGYGYGSYSYESQAAASVAVESAPVEG